MKRWLAQALLRGEHHQDTTFLTPGSGGLPSLFSSQNRLEISGSAETNVPNIVLFFTE